MSSLIEELQCDALNWKIPVTQLLQRCLVVAAKLDVKELAEWVRLELDGYGNAGKAGNADVPKYRILGGIPEGFNPYHGYQPIVFDDAEFYKLLSSMPFYHPISEIEDILSQNEKSKNGSIRFTFPHEMETVLRKLIHGLQPTICINASQLRKVVEAVRRSVLEWSLRLEAAGVHGNGLSFSPEEKEKAQSVTYNIKIQGNVNGSQIGTVHSRQRNRGLQIGELKDFIAMLRNGAKELDLKKEDALELESEIQTLEAQANSPKPKESIIGQSIHAIAEIAKDAAKGTAKAFILSKIKVYTGIDV